ncbi:hypothetical protein CISIN_1g0369222mg, partial [Citrus sinensis]
MREEELPPCESSITSRVLSFLQ